MTLAHNVTDREGHALLVAGTVLEAEMLDRLIRRGVESIPVLVPDTRDEETIAKEIQTAVARVEDIFRGAGSPARESLHTAILDYRQESAQ